MVNDLGAADSGSCLAGGPLGLTGADENGLRGPPVLFDGTKNLMDGSGTTLSSYVGKFGGKSGGRGLVGGRTGGRGEKKSDCAEKLVAALVDTVAGHETVDVIAIGTVDIIAIDTVDVIAVAIDTVDVIAVGVETVFVGAFAVDTLVDLPSTNFFMLNRPVMPEVVEAPAQVDVTS